MYSKQQISVIYTWDLHSLEKRIHLLVFVSRSPIPGYTRNVVFGALIPGYTRKFVFGALIPGYTRKFVFGAQIPKYTRQFCIRGANSRVHEQTCIRGAYALALSFPHLKVQIFFVQ